MLTKAGKPLVLCRVLGSLSGFNNMPLRYSRLCSQSTLQHSYPHKSGRFVQEKTWMGRSEKARHRFNQNVTRSQSMLISWSPYEEG